MHSVRFKDDGLELSPRVKELKENGPKCKPVLQMDPACVGCTQMQADVIKHFKMACLAYTPSPVAFRNLEFSRSQLLIFRKFLMGQCSKVVHLKEPFKGLQMSTKKIFDDTYLFLKEANLSYLRTLEMNKTQEPFSKVPETMIDERNGMPIESYQEVTSNYWNLIYKHQIPEAEMTTDRSFGDAFGARASSVTPISGKRISIMDIEAEYNKSIRNAGKNPVISVPLD